ncbi:MAG: energy transducer TonB [Bacteroidaceae bacterium]|nr:energy transducer TonB [Bacteroidaceae bacterium]
MPNWTPGKQKGKPVRVRFTLPVTFHLNGDAPKQATEVKQPEATDDKIFQVVEEQPEFPGGMEALMKHLSKEIKYPKEAQEKGTQGRVIVQFVVRKDGSITDAKIMKPVDPLLDAEALRVVSEMPNWIPGKQRGEAVNVRFTLPVMFRLSN